MMTCRLQIDDGAIEDSFEKWGFIFIDSDRRTAPPERALEKISFTGEPGEDTDLRTTDDAFDYELKFAIDTPNTDFENANTKITAFNKAIRLINPGNPVKICRRLTVYNDFMRVKIVGIPAIIDLPENFYRKQNGEEMDCVEFTLKVRVNNPALCDFSLVAPPEN
ncbi:MAG: hypothetical protein HDS14_00530 [Bacteroides sp.]|nr:hypothetical protein [Bacteroides sp.]